MPTIELADYTARALKRISPIYDESLFIKNFFNGVGTKYDLLREYFKTFGDQSFIDTVDWAIAVQELKYSLDVRPDLSLEERRARLGIKARTHRPLNPARLEKYIKEKFGIRTYLYEKEAGYIRIYAEKFSESGYPKMIDWLTVEKPAHLSLATYFNTTEYLGGGGYASNTIFNPDVPIELPKTIAAKKNFPRMFAGIAQAITGVKKIGLQEPKDTQNEIIAGVAQSWSGEVTIAPKQLKHSGIVMRAGVSISVVEKVWIDSYEKPTLPYYPFRLEPPYEPDDNHDFYYDMIDKAEIYIKEEEQSSTRLMMKNFKTATLGASNEEYFNDLTFLPEDKLPHEFEWRNITENPYANLAAASFSIARGKYIFEDIVIDTDEWDIVKIFFGFATSRHRRYRGIAMPNPRADLTKEEIKDTGQYAVDNELIKNERGEIANRVLGAAYKRREVTDINLRGGTS